ncbi:nucleoside 2-deoxyribosyltransferase [Kurthia zopfii]|uniref:Nucleoside 2-deoxyribosyltransferase n=1 Tax=Kurthia zopfii TaxID=1650 RepID=A0A8B4QA46_9BACL|nr:nucleoside 2-deoxyribosyltransferase [Kurthia zopfii]PWI22566.1 nucleoside 2-deoxyribosyltransferase [Kurthia zopfii]TDR39022.1 nucleoside 2-deoxyribosyltransferase [Kurthia zopfii]GEK31930.1 nucleoside 2-deoxyribosyltransferase [Kurthia zopfii]STX09558.1 Nucleoside 2-deoxyribosyltransferase [Kurthia zopfii]
MIKGYLANGLFGLGDRLVNELVAKAVRQTIPGVVLYVPQENGAINDKTAFANSEQIAAADLDALKNSDFLIAVIDGVEIDSGVAAEIGAYSMLNRPIFALFTDSRQQGRDHEKKINALIQDAVENQFVYRNLFVVGLIKQNGVVTSSIEQLTEALTTHFSP